MEETEEGGGGSAVSAADDDDEDAGGLKRKLVDILLANDSLGLLASEELSPAVPLAVASSISAYTLPPAAAAAATAATNARRDYAWCDPLLCASLCFGGPLRWYELLRCLHHPAERKKLGERSQGGQCRS